MEIKDCKVCYNCQVSVGSGVDTAKQNKPAMQNKPIVQNKQEMDFVYYEHLTPTCNLQCRYCYTGHNYVKDEFADKETIEETLRYLFITQPRKKFTVHFFGGEPMTRWNDLMSFVTLGNTLAKSHGKEVLWGMTTNGTLLDNEKLDWIAENFKKNNPFLLSLDGRPETHNKYRVTVGGGPSYDMIPVKEILKRFPGIEVRPTIMPDTAGDWFADYCYLRDLGFKSVAIEPSFESSWDEQQLKDYEHLLEQLGQYYIYARNMNIPLRMKWIESVEQYFKTGQVPGGLMCGVGSNCLAIDCRGLIYACQRYASYNDIRLAIGDVIRGVSEFRLFETQNLFRKNVRGDKYLGFDCDTCSARLFCSKGCNSANFKLMGDRGIVIPTYCKLTKIQVKVALQIICELGFPVKKEGETCSRR